MSFAVLVVDLDGFKEVNDRGGHAVGGRVETLLRAADRAMYRAKAAGRGAWRRVAADAGQVPAY